MGLSAESSTQEIEAQDLEKAVEAIPISSFAEIPSEEGGSQTQSGSSSDHDHDVNQISKVPTKTVERPGVLEKTLSLVRTRESNRDPGPPPDGGYHAWLQVALTHMVIFNTWGFVNGFGVFQSYYTEALKRSPSDISWIGGTQIFLLFFIGTFSGRATDAGYFKAVWSAGAVIIIFSLFMTSLCKTYWQTFLSQGVCMGIGSGLIFCPSVALLTSYFARRRSLAIAITASGSATGGIVYPVLVQQLLPKIGFGWTMRVIGLITAVTLTPGFFFLRQRIPPRRTGPFFELQAFREPAYSLYAVAMFLNFWALYIAFFYVGSFGRNVIGLSQKDSINLILIINCCGIFGRLIPCYISDWKSGPINALIPCTVVAGATLFGWIGVKREPNLYAFSITYGFFAAGIQALFPSALTSLTTDLKKSGIRFGMTLSIVSFSSLTGSPIAGALIALRDGDFLYAQIFAGLSMFLSLAVLLLSRSKVVGWKLKARV
ncbi:hypothetical protein H112_07217 [Trichophyton rubrum D6]|uniref:MFS monocarboxylate transporter n=5 Tax=Trichophyton TaxID=5550 RepID=F2SHV1_TRIRC|nr:uncharacterized protein TERG_02545 [Trichophyton rubrum CBS 118892]XP_047605687.1 uncharacterized protein TERG_02545 [Trichophyton rubrum CBS 118892]XP_047605688.1 uncharacterized protein TERG_02545 [Trichophyton rubrum CBS 118892]EZF11690.1 hypothetical protein H100_07243 [Trichophyton rubrum MR850]EZF38575.1 hypothetical protein H102_07203 [Trichophyton rubrum CBS 100081]EZF49102.1 hypothetical protein H103_07226 [Trichophyton rubrum CBS 288.86]EZF59748.1 hypothetical protein H104_07180 